MAGRRALRMTGDVRTENIGGFVQIALDLVTGGRPVDAREWATIVITACGPDEIYNLHLRTAALTRPWQSYRHSFVTGPDWRTFRLPFVAFAAHRTTAPLDLSTMRRIGLVAIGRAFLADLAIAEMHFSA